MKILIVEYFRFQIPETSHIFMGTVITLEEYVENVDISLLARLMNHRSMIQWK